MFRYLLIALLPTTILGWIAIVPPILTNVSFLMAAGIASITFIACVAFAYLFFDLEII